MMRSTYGKSVVSEEWHNYRDVASVQETRFQLHHIVTATGKQGIRIAISVFPGAARRIGKTRCYGQHSPDVLEVSELLHDSTRM